MVLRNTKIIKFLSSFNNCIKNQDGVTAIEFAMVAPVFFGLLLMTIESGIVFAAQQMFDASVYNASRVILTGSLQSQIGTTSPNDLKTQFRDQVCTGMSPLLSLSTCQSGVLIDMKRISATAPIVAANILGLPLNGTQLDSTKMSCANFGSPNEYMLVRGYYQYPVYVSFLGGGAGAKPGAFLLVGSAAMKLEPFPGSGSATDAAGKPTNVSCP